ncbi:hypothetical protein M405DRAFT_494611 [Rhizopogon salebrosus TDB-379]|nr:hypothetical protein M405DRAFT_494611 [Rhizopogon salebrosus TDB-379]
MKTPSAKDVPHASIDTSLSRHWSEGVPVGSIYRNDVQHCERVSSLSSDLRSPDNTFRALYQPCTYSYYTGDCHVFQYARNITLRYHHQGKLYNSHIYATPQALTTPRCYRTHPRPFQPEEKPECPRDRDQACEGVNMVVMFWLGMKKV